MTIRKAAAGDLAAMARIQAAAPEASHWDPADYLSHLCWVAEYPEGVCGFLVVRQVLPDEYEILNLAVAAWKRRQGLGTALVRFALDNFKGAWFLEVRASNILAQKLYYSLGFEQVGVRAAYYEGPCESAIVMKRIS